MDSRVYCFLCCHNLYFIDAPVPHPHFQTKTLRIDTITQALQVPYKTETNVWISSIYVIFSSQLDTLCGHAHHCDQSIVSFGSLLNTEKLTKQIRKLNNTS